MRTMLALLIIAIAIPAIAADPPKYRVLAQDKNHVAIVNADGNVIGLMPHPERALEDLLGSSDGLPFFESILARVAA